MGAGKAITLFLLCSMQVSAVNLRRGANTGPGSATCAMCSEITNPSNAHYLDCDKYCNEGGVSDASLAADRGDCAPDDSACVQQYMQRVYDSTGR
mmetsp:Transcript_80531/g.126891  ORF Transcript_80531/g.126891 Transcript_80531/m.126891 type:complete len:95 (+) Transcript_80531:68-352(+)